MAATMLPLASSSIHHVDMGMSEPVSTGVRDLI